LGAILITCVYDAILFYELGENGPTVFIPNLSGATCGDSEENGIFMAKDLIRCLLKGKHVSHIPHRRNVKELLTIIPVATTVQINNSRIITPSNLPLESHSTSVDVSYNAIAINNALHPNIYRHIFFPDFYNSDFFIDIGDELSVAFQDELKQHLLLHVSNKSLLELPNVRSIKTVLKIIPVRQDFGIDEDGILYL
jgi:hypothetical protein